MELRTIKGKNILITGGLGFIGTNLVQKLLKTGANVSILDDESSSVVDFSFFGDSVTFYKGSILDDEILDLAFRNQEIIFHLAAIADVQSSIDNPERTNEVNVEGTRKVMFYSKKYGINQILFSSSCAVYGSNSNLPLKESLVPKPISPYAQQKLQSEKDLLEFSRKNGITVHCFRFFNVYGPFQKSDSRYSAVVSSFISRAMSDKTLVIDGDGKQSRDFVFVEDVVSALIQASQIDNITSTILNIGTGKETTIIELANTVFQILSKSPQISFAKRRKGDIDRSLSDIQKSRIISYKPKFSLKGGLEDTISKYPI